MDRIIFCVWKDTDLNIYEDHMPSYFPETVEESLLGSSILQTKESGNVAMVNFATQRNPYCLCYLYCMLCRNLKEEEREIVMNMQTRTWFQNHRRGTQLINRILNSSKLNGSHM